MTSFDKVYNFFFSSITDDMYITTSEEEAKEDALDLLEKAIIKFRYPINNILDYDRESQMFNEDISNEECFILSLYMVLEWINRQMATVRLTEMQYTGSDLKSIGTKAQMSTLKEIYSHFEFQLEKQLKYYQYHNEDYLSLSGKGNDKNDPIRTFKKTRRT